MFPCTLLHNQPPHPHLPPSVPRTGWCCEVERYVVSWPWLSWPVVTFSEKHLGQKIFVYVCPRKNLFSFIQNIHFTSFFFFIVSSFVLRLGIADFQCCEAVSSTDKLLCPSLTFQPVPLMASRRNCSCIDYQTMSPFSLPLLCNGRLWTHQTVKLSAHTPSPDY